MAKPALAPTRFVEDLADIANRHQIDMVIPTCEEIFYIAAKLHLFPPTVTVFSEPLSRLEQLHNKWTFASLVKSSSSAIQSPETHLAASPADLQAWIARQDLVDWVFKPVYSRFAARTLVGPKPEIVSTLRPSAADPWVMQRRIRGREFSTYSVAHNGVLRAHACYYSKYQVGIGSGIYFMAVDDERIRSFVQELVARLHFTGQLGFDLIQSDDGKLYVLECNPRATSGLHLLKSLPLAEAFLHQSGALLEPQSPPPSMLAAIVLLFSLPQAIAKRKLATLVADMREARDVMFAWNDLGPSLLSPISLLEVMATALRRRKPLTRAATFDIEWNGEPI
ncbi:ATP-grasp domain-containing protein [Anatilimnocola floriformis]|uniref:ATP-grasp domain-containing protein n=1 Tax=Anatilimnocola floriformis TaxID=2948575 RepID=UPI0020C2D123|nr:ATP-grasp domain-containing protein [Anatilimnocola floriformis]